MLFSDAESHYVVSSYAETHYAESFTKLNVAMMSDVVPKVTMLSVVYLC